ncbi:MAG: C39 family peptidase [Anaerolineales bacterium]
MTTQSVNRTIRILLLIALGLLVVIFGLLALRGVVRALPGRYAYYLPDPLLELRHVPHAQTLATPESSTAVDVSRLLSTATPTSTPVPPTSTAAPSPSTPAVTSTPQATMTPEPLPTPTLPASCRVPGGRMERQGWNNCGPTTLAMQLSFWDRLETQAEIAPFLKPDPEDKNVGPYEMADYARSLGLEAIVRPAGTLERLKRLLAADFPVVIETWYIDHDTEEQMGHYRLLVGYDDALQQFTAYDSLHTPEIILDYQALDELWRGFNRLYLVVYSSERAEELAAILGPHMDESYAFRQALERAQAEALNPPESCVAYAECDDAEAFAWFNVGSSLLALGDYEGAAVAYDQARALGVHYRMIWYQFGPYEAYYTVGRYQDVITLADQILEVTPNLEESYYWRGRARLALGNVDGARADFKSALKYHEGWQPAVDALTALEQ